YIMFNGEEVSIKQEGLQKLKKHGCWMQFIDQHGNVVGSVNTDENLPEHYDLFDIISYTLNSGELEHNTLFVKEVVEYPGYGVIIGCKSKFLQKRSILFFGKQSAIKAGIAFLLVMICVVYMSSYIFSRKITTPIIKIMEDIPLIAKGIAIQGLDRTSIFAGVSRQLEALQYRLQENKRMRTEWIANISHDMKTPLSTIRGYSELLTEEGYQFDMDEVREYAREIVKSEHYIENLIQDLRLSQKLVEGKIPLQKREVELLSMIQDSIERIEQVQSQRDRISVDCDDRIRLYCDPNLMERCLINIISNAFVHNPDGVQVTVRAEQSQNVVNLEIQDDGRGMDEQESRHIFERYYHGTNSQQRGGTGLGLAIAKETVEVHGGTITVESRKDHGTIFIIQLPEEKPC
ncbi:MAG: HAMP domain-containing histidine kinase, partial [Lachnospiraceae bacterium]|nr:HAMP domain-containing histidine kinase [Lachnospiraceae bacterium]